MSVIRWSGKDFHKSKKLLSVGILDGLLSGDVHATLTYNAQINHLLLPPIHLILKYLSGRPFYSLINGDSVLFFLSQNVIFNLD